MASPLRTARMALTTTEAASLLGVSRGTVQRLCRAGTIKGLRTPGGHWRVPYAEVERVLDEMEAAGAAQPTDDERAARGDVGDEAESAVVVLLGEMAG